MSKPGLSFGLNQPKKPGAPKPPLLKKKPLFGGDDDDSDNEGASGGAGKIENFGGDLDDFNDGAGARGLESRAGRKSKPGLSSQPPKLNSKAQHSAMFGDLSSALASKKNADAAAEVDASVFEYDSVYDSLKPKKEETKTEADRKPKYMRSVIQAAEVRKRDQLIAEEKKIAREREAEGDEYADKEKFVTEAYKRQQEENRRLEEEEKRREEDEAKKNEGGGMSAFYRKMLDRDEARHTEIVNAAAEQAKNGPAKQMEDEKHDDGTKEKSEAELARELNDKGASVALNEDGQVVDKRQLLRGGLNVGAKKKEEARRDAERPREPERRGPNPGQFGKKQAMRERQSRMLEDQLEESLKRSREQEAAQREEVERASKSRKTEGEISSAKERYLARKRAAEEAKKNDDAAT